MCPPGGVIIDFGAWVYVFSSPRACTRLADSQRNSGKTIKSSIHKLGFCRRRNRGLIERDIGCLSAVNWGSDTLINPRPYRASAAGTGAEAWLSQALASGRSEGAEARAVLQHQAFLACSWPTRIAPALPSFLSACPSPFNLAQPLCLSEPVSLSANGQGLLREMAQGSMPRVGVHSITPPLNPWPLERCLQGLVEISG